MTINRRNFMAAAAASTLVAAPTIRAQGRPQVVVIGGGPGGATAARYIARDSRGAIDVILVEPSRIYYTCFFSNLYLADFWAFDDLGHGYGAVAKQGVNVVHDWAIGVDRDARTVSLAGGGVLQYDRLVLAPGVDFVPESVPGWSIAAQNHMPHAYKAGSQTQLLKAQIQAMPEGGVFALVAPPDPFRCPPGPYERISMVAHVLRDRNPTAKILLVDPKEHFSKEGLFAEGWEALYTGMIDRIGPEFGGNRVEVRPARMEVVIDGMVEKIDVCNVIPGQRAGRICELAGVNEGNWAPVVPATMQSRFDENIHVLGDSSNQGDMPKSGFAANSQAKVAAMAIQAALIDTPLFPARYSNTCWSLIGTDNGVKVGASYEATDEKIAKVDGFISQTGENAELRRRTYEESLGWYAGIIADVFG